MITIDQALHWAGTLGSPHKCSHIYKHVIYIYIYISQGYKLESMSICMLKLWAQEDGSSFMKAGHELWSLISMATWPCPNCIWPQSSLLSLLICCYFLQTGNLLGSSILGLPAVLPDSLQSGYVHYQKSENEPCLQSQTFPIMLQTACCKQSVTMQRRNLVHPPVIQAYTACLQNGQQQSCSTVYSDYEADL